MRVFVSYTLRDGVLSACVLAELASRMRDFCSPYVDIVHNRSENPQAHVLRQLSECEVVLACMTPGFLASPWVGLELSLAQARACPIVPIDIRGHHAGYGWLPELVFSAFENSMHEQEWTKNGMKRTTLLAAADAGR
jgi:hypothetical protein